MFSLVSKFQLDLCSKMVFVFGVEYLIFSHQYNQF